MNNKRLCVRLLVFCLVSVMMTGCEKYLGNNGGLPGGCEMTARIDGKNFCGNGVFTFDEEYADLSLLTYGEEATESIHIFVDEGDVGTFELGEEKVNQATYAGELKGYLATSGTVKVTRLTENRCVGTFSFTAKEVAGNGTVEVTNGKFDLDRFGN